MQRKVLDGLGQRDEEIIMVLDCTKIELVHRYSVVDLLCFRFPKLRCDTGPQVSDLAAQPRRAVDLSARPAKL